MTDYERVRVIAYNNMLASGLPPEEAARRADILAAQTKVNKRKAPPRALKGQVRSKRPKE